MSVSIVSRGELCSLTCLCGEMPCLSQAFHLPVQGDSAELWSGRGSEQSQWWLWFCQCGLFFPLSIFFVLIGHSLSGCTGAEWYFITGTVIFCLLFLIISAFLLLLAITKHWGFFITLSVMATVCFGFFNGHQGCKIFHTHSLDTFLQWMFAAVLQLLSITMSCPSLPFVLLLSTLDSYMLPAIFAC